jgi:DNA-binding transcriptional LysR family regulator
MNRDRISHMTATRPPNEMTAFVRAVELEGFSAAARDLALSPSAVSKMITRIENRLGVRLLNRTTRKLVLTEEGESYLSHCRRILAEIEQAEIELSRRRDVPSGVLRVNCGLTFGQSQLVAAMPEFLDRYPEVRVELTLTDQLVDLMEEGVDLVIRIGRVADSSLVARKICDLERVICASPDYLKRFGEPRSPNDLHQHNCLYLTTSRASRRWPFKTPKGRTEIEVNGNFAVNSMITIVDLALRGVGIARLGDPVASEPIRQGRLVPILTDTNDVEPVPLYALFPLGRHRSPKLTSMLNFLIEKFAHAPWRTPVNRARRQKNR